MQKKEQARRERISGGEISVPILPEVIFVLHHLNKRNLVRVKVRIV